MNHSIKRALMVLSSLAMVASAAAQIIRVEVTSPVNESATVYNPSASAATAIATIQPAGVLTVNVTSPGTNYTAPVVTVNTAGTGVASATATATIAAGKITAIAITPTSGYTAAPTLTITDPTGTGAAATVQISPGAVTGITFTGGAGYLTTPTITFSGGNPTTPATATATVSNGTITAITFTGGTGYTTAPTVTIDQPPGVVTLAARVTGTPSAGTQFFVNGKAVSGTIGGDNPTWAWNAPQPGSYFITAKTSDAFGNSATSLPARVFVTGAKIFSPIAHTALPRGSSIVVSADAEVGTTALNPFTGQTVFTPGFVKQIEFFVTDAPGAMPRSIGVVVTAPYSVSFTPTGLGFYSLTATATDNNGRTVTSANLVDIQVVNPIGTPPRSLIANPVNNGTVAANSTVNIIADAGWARDEPNPGIIVKVEFYLNGVLLNTDTTFPFTASWTPPVPGRYTLVALAFDDKGNVITSSPTTVNVTGGLPTAQITSPSASGLTVIQGTKLAVTVSAAGSDGGISSLRSVEFLVDGNVNDALPKNPAGLVPPPPLTQPFVFTWQSNVALGTHRLSARATDVNGLTITSSEVTVNVIPNQLPLVSLTNPTAGTTIAPNTPTMITATASDTDGSVESVEFFVNGVTLGTPVAKPPFQATWTPANSGSYVLTAKVTDNAGATVTSSEVVVTVESAPTPDTVASGGSSNSVFRGSYGSVTESGRFALGVNRNGRGTFVGFSTTPAGRTYFWTDFPINPDGTFSVRDSAGAVVLSGQTSATGVAGTFGDKTFIGPIALGTVAPLLFAGAIEGNPNSSVIAIVGGDGSVTIYAASGNNREIGSDTLGTSGAYSFPSSGGGRITGTVTPSAGIISGTVSGSVAGSFLIRQQAGRLVNISTRSLAGSGDRTLVAGFVIRGSGAKPLLIRAVGPTLANFGVNTPLADPALNVVSSSNALVASNDDWGSTPALVSAAAQVGAFALNANSRDAALQTSLAPGAYSAIVGGGSPAGNALVEIYDAETGVGGGSAQITNISTRGQVVAGEPLVAGFVIAGDLRKKLLIRAVGPTLANFNIAGALADPKIDVLSGTTVITSNNDWGSGSSVAAVTSTTPAVGAFPLTANSRDAALVVQLNPGVYTVQVTGVGSSSGTVLVEIYDADR